MTFERAVPLGSISSKQQKKFNLTAKRTTVQSARMAGQQDDDNDADDRGGLRDQGGVRDRGAIGVRHIDKNQRKGSAIASAPTRGSGAGKERQPVRVRHIDDGATQRPNWPAGGSSVKGAKAKTPSAARGPKGPMQRAGKQDQWDGASNSRP